jgi:lysophospholipase L1-like esterase
MKRLLLCVTFFVTSSLSAADKPFFFKAGDRVIFLGDSITEQYQYSTDIELYLTTHFPEWKIFFLNAGIGGDTANGGAGRFQKHILDEKPTAVTINFGMNDGGYGGFNKGSNALFVQKTTEMVEAAKKAGVRIALISPNAVDPRVQKRFDLYLETQKQFYAPLKEIADKHGTAFADQYATTRTALEKMGKVDPEAKKLRPFGDGFHTSPPGGLLMAYAILTGLHAPATVGNVKIEGSKVVAEERSKVSDFVTGDGKISFKRTDEAIPMPIQNDWAPYLPFMNDLKDLNYYGLEIKGLKNGIWGVLINGKPVGEFSADQLAGGVNLGNVSQGPVFDLGQKVFAAINDKNRIVAERFHGVVRAQVPAWLADVAEQRRPAELAKRLDQIVEKQAAIYKMLEPQTWAYEIKFIK